MRDTFRRDRYSPTCDPSDEMTDKDNPRLLVIILVRSRLFKEGKMRLLREFIRCLINEIKREFGWTSSSKELWSRLCEAKQFDLIVRLRKIEIEPKSNNVFLMPDGSLTGDHELDSLVVEWLEARDVIVYNTRKEIQELTRSLEVR